MNVRELEEEKAKAELELEAQREKQESHKAWLGYRIIIYILIATLLFFVYMDVIRKHDIRDDILGCLGFKEINRMDF